MLSRNFILPESANYVFFYAFSFLRNLLYLIRFDPMGYCVFLQINTIILYHAIMVLSPFF